MNNKILKWLLMLLVLTAACKKKEERASGSKAGEPSAKAIPARVAGRVIGYGSFPIELVSNGKLEATKKAALSFRKQSSIARILVKNGDWVNQGDVIAELENDPEKIQLEQAEVRLEKARLDRLNQIIGFRAGARNPEDVPPDILNRFNISSGYTDADLNLQQYRIQFEYTRLIAPVSGRVASLEAKAGNFPPTAKPFCLLIDDSEFDVIFPVLEGERARLQNGLEVAVEPFAIDSFRVAGTITEINPLIDEHGLVRVKAFIPNHTGRLVEGMNCRVLIRFSMPECLIIPKEALVLRNNRQVVFSLKNGRSSWNYVETGLENSTSYSIRILEGLLRRGDTIITHGNLNLAHDAEVSLTMAGGQEGKRAGSKVENEK